MFPEMVDGNAPTNPSAIEEFEPSHSVTLPGLYKEFLLTTNGGRPKTPAFPIEGMPLNPIGVVQFFFGIHANLSVYDLVEIFDEFRNRIPDGILPIACTGGGDYVCLDLRKGQDRVVFWDNRPFWGTGEWRERDLYRVAASFAEFLRSLGPNPY
jgi:hypothetical protein